jgi:hypothetical protein
LSPYSIGTPEWHLASGPWPWQIRGILAGIRMAPKYWALTGLLLLASGPAFAGHGKAGLWRVSSTTDLKITLPPAVESRMKTMGHSPNVQSHTTQMCMSQAEVDSDRPPHIDPSGTGCDTHIISQTAWSMKAKMVCDGRMKGTGELQITYARDNAHYSGRYSFQGSVEGNPARMATSFRGDWVKADCGAVKPYALRTQ